MVFTSPRLIIAIDSGDLAAGSGLLHECDHAA
jgi:hypothetical protein